MKKSYLGFFLVFFEGIPDEDFVCERYFCCKSDADRWICSVLKEWPKARFFRFLIVTSDVEGVYHDFPVVGLTDELWEQL